MNTRRNPVVVAVTAVAVCASVTVVGPPAHAQTKRVDPTDVRISQFDDIGYVVAHRKEQMAHDYVANAAYRAGQAAAGPGA